MSTFVKQDDVKISCVSTSRAQCNQDGNADAFHLLRLLLVFGKVEGILIISLEKWKFVHKLR